MIRIRLVCIIMLGTLTSVFAQTRFDRTSGKKIYLDRSKYEGTWVSKKNPEDFKINISFETKHFKENILNYYSDYFIVDFLKLKQNGEDLTKKYDKMTSDPVLREGLIQRVSFIDPRAEILLDYEFKPLENGDLLITPHRWEMEILKYKGAPLFEYGKAILLTRVK